jgi:ferredoxin
VKVLLRIGKDDISRPLIAEVILATGAEISIEAAKIDGVSGELIVNVPEKQSSAVLKLLKERNIEVITLDQVIDKDDDECVHCGACISVCPVKALSNLQDWSVELEKERCVRCGICVLACPHRALAITG